MRRWPLSISAAMLSLVAHALVLASEPSLAPSRPITLVGRVVRDNADSQGPPTYSLAILSGHRGREVRHPLVATGRPHREFLEAHAGTAGTVRVSGLLTPTHTLTVLVIETIEEYQP